MEYIIYKLDYIEEDDNGSPGIIYSITENNINIIDIIYSIDEGGALMTKSTMINKNPYVVTTIPDGNSTKEVLVYEDYIYHDKDERINPPYNIERVDLENLPKAVRDEYEKWIAIDNILNEL